MFPLSSSPIHPVRVPPAKNICRLPSQNSKLTRHRNRAQPNRMMCHNGEINTLRGNKNWMHARGGLLHSEYFGDETANLLPVCSDNMSDSGNFDSVLELSVKAGDREIPEVCEKRRE